MSAIGERVVRLAEAWIGTPYRHQGATPGVGCDCIGLIRGVWRGLYGEEPEVVPPYAADWAERSGDDRLLAAGLRLFGPAVPLAEMSPGDVLLFRWRPGCAAKHAGIFCGADRFIHAYEQAAVTRSVLVPSWRRRIAAVHRFRDERNG
ncbi:peptidase P60 [Rhizobiales bacterium RZME27]|uniref:Peptidase P60 n=1 Tax=Endobacterium cereale TaxID=2663029 RepID=A0A6A8AFB8_9HYPH|nr:NlpC/P60 family protein [Endobacterium cereale]MEB2847144.1 NlpC/P60 family protein [Endobacterium cereale]MQY47441.1 peptidase P60 [Endobacterium cereale]